MATSDIVRRFRYIRPLVTSGPYASASQPLRLQIIDAGRPWTARMGTIDLESCDLPSAPEVNHVNPTPLEAGGVPGCH